MGFLVLGVLFALWGIRCLLAVLSRGAGPAESWPQLAIAILVLATAYGLLRFRSWAPRVYAIWVGLAIILGLAREVMAGTPTLVVVLWGLLIGSVYVAIGAYIKSNSPEAG